MTDRDLDRDADRRAAFRAFVRDHHPDVGGDPETFRRGLEVFRAGGVPDLPAGPVGGPRTGPVPWPRLADDDPRLDVPVTAVSDAVLHRLGRAGVRLWRGHLRHPLRRGSGRVL